MAEDSATKSAGGNSGEGAVGSIARYASSNIFRHLMRVANAFLKPMLLAPELLGLWNLLNIIPNYLPFVYLGSTTAMRYQIPANQARGDAATNRALAGAAFSGTLGLSLLVVAGLLVTLLVVPMSQEARAGLGTMAIFVLLAWYHEYQISLLKAEQQFRLLSAVNFIYATVLSILSLVLILLFRIYGLYAALLLSLLAVIIFIRVRYRPAPLSPYRHAVFCQLIKSGLPIMLFSLGAMLIRTSDKLIISSVLGLKSLGHYGIATMVFGFMMHVPGATREVLEPKLMYDRHQRTEAQILQAYLVKPLLATGYLMPLLIGPAVLLLPDFVSLLMPVYAAGVPAAQILLVGGYFLALSHILRGLIVANEAQSAAAKIMFAVTLVNLGLSLLLLRLGWGIAGVAAASACSFWLLFVAQFFLIRRCMPAAAEVLTLWSIWRPFLWCAGLLGVLCLLRAYLSLPAIPATLGALAVYGGLFLVIYNRAARRYACFAPLGRFLPGRR